MVNRKKIHCGLFKRKEAAIAVRNANELKYFKKYSAKKKKFKIGLTFGVFCFLHEGHIKLLQNAKKYVDVLIVCVSNDAYSLKHKGKKPPIKLRNRQKSVYALDFVDCVDVQSLKFGKKEAIEKYCPTYLFVGNDHRNDYTGEGLGIPVIYLPHTDNISTTQIINEIKGQN